ncbi:NAD-dependent protein deacylase [Carnobacterium sp. TMP28]|uniref:NAD-dependent protein deacylase n=1 Tax=Carnobacterium sp. TMP28 TaxID=3397060 RepID=UPI0039E03636
MTNPIETLQQFINEAEHITFFGGAGVSTESGLPDYRSDDGAYTELERQKLDPRRVMSKRYLINSPEKFFNQPNKNKKWIKPEPNAAHLYLAALENKPKDVRIITQNVDRLHQTAGSKLVVELHGNNRHFHCMVCGREYKPKEIQKDEQNIPRCPIDNGIIRADVVLFGENIKPEVLARAKELIASSDLLIIAGTSLTVHPAKNLIHYFTGKRVVVINKTPLKIDLPIDLVIQEAVGETFKKLSV